MMRAVAALALLAPVVARAGACCVGTVTAVPTRLGPCEHVTIALGASGERSFARWDSKGSVRGNSLVESTATAQLAVGVGFSRRWQVGLAAPLLVNARSAGDLSTSGFGPGDARVLATWLPVEEVAPEPGRLGRPAPVWTAGLRLPTGRDWRTSQDPLLADVTGLPGAAVVVGAQLERTYGDTPWLAGVTTETGVAGGSISPTVTAYGGVGRYLGSDWTVFGSVTHTESVSRGAASWARGARTTAGIRVITGRSLRWRAWGAADVDVPVPGLGADRATLARIGGGVAWIR
jgi:hypothetical protein